MPLTKRLLKGKKSGYLLVLIAVCVCATAIGFLRLASSAASMDAQAAVEYARARALYLAEGGLVIGQVKLNSEPSLPPLGPWLAVLDDHSGAHYSVEVVAASGGSEIELLSSGFCPAPGDKIVLVVLEARLKRQKNNTWAVVQIAQQK